MDFGREPVGCPVLKEPFTSIQSSTSFCSPRCHSLGFHPGGTIPRSDCRYTQFLSWRAGVQSIALIPRNGLSFEQGRTCTNISLSRIRPLAPQRISRRSFHSGTVRYHGLSACPSLHSSVMVMTSPFMASNDRSIFQRGAAGPMRLKSFPERRCSSIRRTAHQQHLQTISVSC